MMRMLVPLILLGALCVSAVKASVPLVLDVWPGKPADDDAATIGAEKFSELRVNAQRAVSRAILMPMARTRTNEVTMP